MAIEDYYDTLVSRITMSTGSWGSTGTRTTAGTFYAAFNPEGQEAMGADRKTVFYDARFYCDADETLEHKDLIRINSVDYNIVLIKDTFNMGHHKKVLLKRQA
jgi:hypothetical protein